MIETKGNGMTIVNRYDILVIEPVMPGHPRLSEKADVDGRNKSGHDERGW
jgi:hypothetical protein